jgi:hypothetical protein
VSSPRIIGGSKAVRWAGEPNRRIGALHSVIAVSIEGAS